MDIHTLQAIINDLESMIEHETRGQRADSVRTLTYLIRRYSEWLAKEDKEIDRYYQSMNELALEDASTLEVDNSR